MRDDFGSAHTHTLSTRESLAIAFRDVRAQTERLTAPLEIEDYVVQSMPDVSPTRWHLAHTSWFFETFVLKTLDPNYRSIDPLYDYLFNSYYNLVGERWARQQRGILTRPTVREVFEYRAHVDRAMVLLLERLDEAKLRECEPIITLGLNHEQQHQELLLTDIKHVLAQNPLHPIYLEKAYPSHGSSKKLAPSWGSFDAGLYEIGFAGEDFTFDNELPRHKVYLDKFELSESLVTAGEYLKFMEAGGYQRPEIWLSEGWSEVQTEHLLAPLYWQLLDGAWWHMTLTGFRKVTDSEPVTHLSFYEADAFAAWSGMRLPTEAEWEVAASSSPVEGNFVESGEYHPLPENLDQTGIKQLFGDVWQWTSSSYSPYPGFHAAEGAIGEYNGKFMSNQMVLRGASCITPRSHARRSYRNFFPPSARWQFSGIRLARTPA